MKARVRGGVGRGSPHRGESALHPVLRPLLSLRIRLLLKHRGLTGKYFIDSPRPCSVSSPSCTTRLPTPIADVMGQSSDSAPATQCRVTCMSPACRHQMHWGQHPDFVATSGQAVAHSSGCKWGSDFAGSHEDSCSWEEHLGVWLLTGTQSSMAPTCHLTRAPKIFTLPGGARMGGGQLGDQACTHQLSKAQNNPGLLGGCWGPTTSPTHSGRAISRVQAAVEVWRW